ncbi:hypothetical protein ACFORL_06460 [Legionella dresdenensis]|uniref:Lipoprotein n=1 Tax=Legionella dresdenensis TaxID=450200 RepID=A0ABV8CEM6_9GAMM
MKRMYMSLLFLPLLGACTVGNSYYGYDNRYPYASGYTTHYHETPVQNHALNDQRTVVRKPERHTQRAVRAEQRGSNEVTRHNDVARRSQSHAHD